MKSCCSILTTSRCQKKSLRRMKNYCSIHYSTTNFRLKKSRHSPGR
jgi:hypothetical protein